MTINTEMDLGRYTCEMNESFVKTVAVKATMRMSISYFGQVTIVWWESYCSVVTEL